MDYINITFSSVSAQTIYTQYRILNSIWFHLASSALAAQKITVRVLAITPIQKKILFFRRVGHYQKNKMPNFWIDKWNMAIQFLTKPGVSFFVHPP